MMLGAVRKQPEETYRRTIDYSDALIAEDSLATASLKAVTPSGLTITEVTVISPRTYFWISGGVDGETYTVEITTMTAAGEIFEDEVVVHVGEVP